MTEERTTDLEPDQTIRLRLAALDAASRIHQRVSVPNNNHTSTATDDRVLSSAAAYERYLRTGEYPAP